MLLRVADFRDLWMTYVTGCRRINEDKCVGVSLSTKWNLPPPQIIIGVNKLPWESKVQNLGLTLDTRLTFRLHFSAVAVRFLQAQYAFAPFLCWRSFLSIEIKWFAYRSLHWIPWSDSNQDDSPREMLWASFFCFWIVFYTFSSLFRFHKPGCSTLLYE